MRPQYPERVRGIMDSLDAIIGAQWEHRRTTEILNVRSKHPSRSERRQTADGSFTLLAPRGFFSVRSVSPNARFLSLELVLFLL